MIIKHIKIRNHIGLFISFLAFGLICSCGESSHDEMIQLLKEEQAKNYSPQNAFNPEAQLQEINKNLKPGFGNQYLPLKMKASLLLKTGHELDAVKLYEDIIKNMGLVISKGVLPDLGIAYMRLGERSNCMLNHNEASCIFPIKDGGVHLVKTGSQEAIDVYEKILKDNPDDLESKWLLNIAYMTLGGYPKKVPQQFLLPGLDADTGYKVKPFTDMAIDVGLNVNGKAGGVIIDDFNADGYLDVVTSGIHPGDCMHYFRNNKDGTFADITEQSGLKDITGGLNIQQTDYNNDGYPDIFVLRGAWGGSEFGDQPSSLLRNNGDGTFTDVTTTSGLLLFEPTQAAVWADFNNDGWLDVFIGAESSLYDIDHPCALYINNHDGTFTNIAQKAHCNYTGFIKGITAADYNNDGKPDIFISYLDGGSQLLKNKGKTGDAIDFEDVTVKAGIDKYPGNTFGTWFFDYNNDGWPDIVACNYNFKNPNKALGYFAAAEALKKSVPNAGNILLYKNNHDGTFTNVTKEAGLDKVVFAMGCNFGDIDNDGYPDMYFGTGNPDFKSLIPNKLFKNVDGKRFADVTISSRTGNLQKGHGVAFADLRNVGKQDIFIEMGGAFSGDGYTSSLYVNPGQNNNNWISLKLIGVKANKAAIGSRIKLTFTENGVKRSVYKDVNSGGSFGSSPLRQEIGIGRAALIDEIEIKWAGSQTVQQFKHIEPNQFLNITEGDEQITVTHLNKLNFKKKQNMPLCGELPASL